MNQKEGGEPCQLKSLSQGLFYRCVNFSNFYTKFRFGMKVSRNFRIGRGKTRAVATPVVIIRDWAMHGDIFFGKERKEEEEYIYIRNQPQTFDF